MRSPLRQILVHLDHADNVRPRLAAACRLAAPLGAQVTALYAATPAITALPYGPDLSGGVATVLQEMDDQRREAARAAFTGFAVEGGPLPTWAESQDIPVIGVVAQQALFADLLVLGQRDPRASGLAMVPGDFVEAVVLASGKPALVLPYVGWQGAIGQRVAIAWKDTAQAARAVTAALPLLARAAEVHVLAWDDESAPAVQGDRLDLDSFLRAHGVTAQWHRGGEAPPELGELLLSRASDLEADLLVMGCYGHSRAREWVLGGTSRTLLQSMTLPVLLAH